VKKALRLLFWAVVGSLAVLGWVAAVNYLVHLASQPVPFF